MLTAITRLLIKRMSVRYDYDVSYMQYLLTESPKAFGKFMKVGALSRHRERVPREASLTVQLLATMFEDCGSCTQLFVSFAKEAKMAANQIEAVLMHNEAAMNPTVALAYRYATAVLHGHMDVDDARDAVRHQWDDKGLVDLAMAMQGARLYPMMKNALGYAQSCECVKVEGRWITFAK